MNEAKAKQHMDCPSDTSDPVGDIMAAAIVRLEEKCAVIDMAESAWQCSRISDENKLRVMIDVRRTLVDVIEGLQSASPSV